MIIRFNKFHGAGNDFVIVENRDLSICLTSSQIKQLCHRNYGIGADGLILAEADDSGEIIMRYYNADGNEATMCGNGGRCLAAWAVKQGLFEDAFSFKAIDGYHHATVRLLNCDLYEVKLSMSEVRNFNEIEDGYFVDTGSPHVVKFIDYPDLIDVHTEGRKIRLDQQFQPDGVNVNFANIGDEAIRVRTYERGVEAETLSCGTGVTATAIAFMLKTGSNIAENVLVTSGGEMKVKAFFNGIFFQDVWLEGPAEFIFSGEIKI